MARVFFMGAFLGLVIVGLLYLLSLWQDDGDDWRGGDGDEAPGPKAPGLELEPEDETSPEEEREKVDQ